MKRLIALGIASGVLALYAQNAAVPPVTPTTPVSQGEDQPYGFELGTIGGSASFGAAHLGGLSGMHPAILGSFDVGLHKYLGIFADGGWSHAGASACTYGACASVGVHFYDVSGGLEIVGTNHSRIVPYAKVGFGYVDAQASAKVNGFTAGSGSAGAPAPRLGGGVRAYLNHHIAIDAQVTALRTVGNNGGATIIAPTVGVFFQSR